MDMFKSFFKWLNKFKPLFFIKRDKKDKVIKGKYYDSASVIPLKIFMDVSVTGDLSLLCYEGSVEDVALLHAAWEDIYQEYLATLYPEVVNELGDKVDLEQLRFKVICVGIIVDYLRVRYDGELVSVLKDYGFNFKFDKDDIDLYHKDLNKVVTSSKFWVMRVKELEGAYDDKNKNKDVSLTYDYFDKAIFELSRFAGYEIDVNKVTALAFASRYNSMIKYYERNKTKK